MSHDTFIAALRALDAPYVVEEEPASTPAGLAYGATSTDGREVVVTRLAPPLNRLVRDRDALLHVLSKHAVGGGVAADGSIYFVEPPHRGAPLSARLAREGPLSSTVLRPIAVRAAEALRQLQATHGPHGLVTPDSLLVAPDGSVQLRWGGLFAALRAGGLEPDAIGGTLGCALHLAPELQRGGDPSNASDVFALGTTLYEALTGRPPFGGRTTATVMATVLSDASGQGQRRAPLTATVLRAIEQDPADRWNDARQFADELEERPTTAPRPPRRPRRRLKSVGVAAAFAATALLLWWLID